MIDDISLSHGLRRRKVVIFSPRLQYTSGPWLRFFTTFRADSYDISVFFCFVLHYLCCDVSDDHDVLFCASLPEHPDSHDSREMSLLA